MMIPKLFINKNIKRKEFNELLEIAYSKLNNNKQYIDKAKNNNDNNFYHEIFYFYKNNKTNNLANKIYIIFPNVNFEFRQIKNLSFSNTNLNKYLINSKFKFPEMENNIKEIDSNNNNIYKTGFFTMSQNHRLIALKDDISEYGDINKSKSLKEIIVGIWINLKEENPTRKSDLDALFNKYKFLIYKECFNFIQLSNNIETIYSPSPEENIFLLVLFYNGIQYHFEVKMNLNNEEKNIYNNNKNQILLNSNNYWMISKFKYEIEEQKLKIPFDFDIKIEIINNGKIFTMADYLNKKNKNNIINNSKEKNKEEIIKEKLNLNNNNCQHKQIKSSNEINILNNTSSIFDLSDYDGDYPLANPNMNKNHSNNNIIKNIQNKNETNTSSKKQLNEISRASTNALSNKPSLSSSKNSGKINISNIDFINQINQEENILNENKNSSEIINQYTSTIMKNSESIKKLENQINKLENNIIEIINELEKEEKGKNKDIKHNNKVKKRKEKTNNANNIDNLNNNNQNISNIGDISINVPRIIYKELSITRDDL